MSVVVPAITAAILGGSYLAQRNGSAPTGDGTNATYRRLKDYCARNNIKVNEHSKEWFNSRGLRTYSLPYEREVAIPQGYQDPSVLAHEIGHIKQQETTPGNTIGHAGYYSRQLGKVTSPLAALANTVLAATGSDYKTMGMIAGANALVQAPHIANELGASLQGALAARESGASLGEQAGAFGGVPSHLVSTLAPGVPMLVRYLYDKLKSK
ncbi:MAG: hypothetical protein RR182_00670 [Alistipes sp.]